METKTTSSQEIRRIMREIHVYKRTTEREIRLLKMKIAKLQKMIEKSVIPEDNPDAYEIKAIRDFESKKKKEGIEFVPLDSLN
jgi:hypothetical protein